jgi:hypothetical protein
MGSTEKKKRTLISGKHHLLSIKSLLKEDGGQNHRQSEKLQPTTDNSNQILQTTMLKKRDLIDHGNRNLQVELPVVKKKQALEKTVRTVLFSSICILAVKGQMKN